MNLGVVKLGMYYSYTPGLVELLDESVYHFQGPDLPQQSIPDRIRQGYAGFHCKATPRH